MRLTRESQSIREGSARHVDYAYDKAANVLTLTYSSGMTIATSYDALGRGDVLKRNGNPIADYDYLGQRLKTLTFETGTDDVQLTQAFDGVGRLTRMTYAQAGNTGLPDFSYGFDAASNITKKGFEHRSGAPSEDYGYDTLHRLTRTAFGQRASGGTPYEGFVYDHLGNHLVQDDNGTTVAGVFNAVNEQTKRGTTALSHDLRGNLTEDDQGQVYLYDRQNLLTRVEDGSSSRIASYAYDALGRRIEKDVQGGTVTEFYWNGQQLVEEADASGAVQRKYVWSPSGGYIDDLVQFIDSTGGSDVAYFACRHHNFNVVALLSSSGSVVERYDYNPYGKRFVLDSDYSDDADGLSDVAFQVGHQGLMHDAETGLVYNRARMLHAVLGRFVQRDVLVYIDGMSFYEYVRSNPSTLYDPEGTFVPIVIAGVYIGAPYVAAGAAAIGAGVYHYLAPGREERERAIGDAANAIGDAVSEAAEAASDAAHSIQDALASEDAYDSPEDAVGEAGIGGLEPAGSGKTKNEGLKAEGYTETEYYRDSSGCKWTVHRNPKTGKYKGAHESSGQ